MLKYVGTLFYIEKMSMVNGRPFVKYLTKEGEFAVAAGTASPPFKTWKTEAGANRWMEARPTFKTGHEKDGSCVRAVEVDISEYTPAKPSDESV